MRLDNGLFKALKKKKKKLGTATLSQHEGAEPAAIFLGLMYARVKNLDMQCVPFTVRTNAMQITIAIHVITILFEI